MTKYLVVPAFIAMILSITSCERFVEVILDDDTVCGEDVNTGYQPVSNEAYAMMPQLSQNTRFVYTNAAGEEMVLICSEKREQKAGRGPKCRWCRRHGY